MRLAPSWSISTAALNRRRLRDPRHLPAGGPLAGSPVNAIAGRRVHGVVLVNRPATRKVFLEHRRFGSRLKHRSRGVFAAAHPALTTPRVRQIVAVRGDSGIGISHRARNQRQQVDRRASQKRIRARNAPTSHRKNTGQGTKLLH